MSHVNYHKRDLQQQQLQQQSTRLIIHLLIPPQFSNFICCETCPSLLRWNCLFCIFPTKTLALSANYISSYFAVLAQIIRIQLEVANAALRWGVNTLCVFQYLMS